jgi:arginyl-tRNA synthetase
MKELIKKMLTAALDKMKTKGQIPLDFNPEIVIKENKNNKHGDYSTNLPLLIEQELNK